MPENAIYGEIDQILVKPGGDHLIHYLEDDKCGKSRQHSFGITTDCWNLWNVLLKNRSFLMLIIKIRNCTLSLNQLGPK